MEEEKKVGMEVVRETEVHVGVGGEVQELYGISEEMGEKVMKGMLWRGMNRDRWHAMRSVNGLG